MLSAVLIINNNGKPRLLKFYENFTEDKKEQIVRECFSMVHKRNESMCNFIYGGSLLGPGTRIIYRQYATLYFIFCADESESELGILDLIQVFVETLDRCFENVCELDIIFNTDKVYYILDEVITGGMVLETNMTDILTQVDAAKQEEVEFNANPMSEMANRAMAAGAGAIGAMRSRSGY